MRTRLRTVAGLAVATALTLGSVAACGSSDDGASGSGGVETINLALGTPTPVLNGMYFYWAQDKGFYAKHKVQVKITGYNGDPTALRAAQTGAADVAWIGANIALNAVAAGSPVKMIDAVGPKLEYLLVGDKTIPNTKSFTGKTLAISGPGASSEIVPLLMIAAAGGNPSQVHTVAIGGQSARVTSLIAGRVNGTLVDPTHLSQVQKVPGMHVIGKSAEALPDYLSGVDIATTKAISGKADALARFEAALRDTAQWAQRNPDQAAAATQAHLKDTPIADIKAATEDYSADKFYNPAGTIAQAAYDYTMQIGLRQKQISKPISYQQAVDTTILDRAKKS